MKQIAISVIFGMIIMIIIYACLPQGALTQPSQGEVMSTSLPKGSVQINGAGATFPLPVYTEWNYTYQYIDPSVTLNYQGIGSGGGKKAIIDNVIDYAGSDSLLKPDEYNAGKDLQMYPILAGAIVLIYNLEGITIEDPTLIVNGEILARIYDGSITKWNDPAIIAINPELTAKLNDITITGVHRSDGSGTTEIFTKFLSTVSDEWASNVGAGSSVEWPIDKAGNGIGGKGNQGVAAAVQNTTNSIGYVELSYAIANQILYAKMRNKAGTIVDANAESLAFAMNDFSEAFNEKLTTRIVDGHGAGSWPLAGYTYIILHTTSMQDCTKANKLLEYFIWALSDPDAAQRAAKLGYSVLPKLVRDKVLFKLREVTCQGQPVNK